MQIHIKPKHSVDIIHNPIITNYITFDQAHKIINRAYMLLQRMELVQDKILELSSDYNTKRLMNNFYNIIEYGMNMIRYGDLYNFEKHFQKLADFCGQIEHILVCIRRLR